MSILCPSILHDPTCYGNQLHTSLLLFRCVQSGFGVFLQKVSFEIWDGGQKSLYKLKFIALILRNILNLKI